MPKYVTHPWALCDRCRRKFKHSDLSSDPNYPGLMVCRADRDILDPYRLRPRNTEDIVLRFVRPDATLVTERYEMIIKDYLEDLQLIVENSAETPFNAIYVGVAVPGASTNAAAWQIQKLSYDSNNKLTNKQFANKSTEFNFIWDSRAGYTYG